MSFDTMLYRILSLSLLCLPWGCRGAARALEAAPSSHAVQTLPAKDDGKYLLLDTARIATSAGAGQLAILGFGAGVAGDSVDAFVYIPRSRCALVFARATESVQDLDLALYGDDGTQLSIDEAPDDLPTLILCPKTDERVFVTARIAQGKGLVAIGLQDFPERDTEMVQRAVGARGLTPSPSEADEGWPGLGSAIQSHRRSLGGSWKDLRRVALPVDSRVPTRLGVTVPKESCLDVLLLPGDGVGALGLVAIDREERVFARSREAGLERHLLFCADGDDEPISLEVHPRLGRGLSVLVLSTLADSNERLALSHDAEVLRLGTPKKAPRPPRAPHSRLKLALGAISSFSFHSKGCSRMDLVAEGTLVGVDAHVWDREAQLVGHSVSTYSAPIFVCAKGELRVDLEARERGGELSAYITPLFGVPDALLHLPLAASRLLMSAEALGLPGFTKHGKVEEATLLAEKIVRRTLNVEASSCAVVLAAKDSSGGGLQLRLFDEEKGIELDDSQGLETAKATACATDDGPLALLMELRILRGSAEVLWTMQPLSD